MTYKGQFYLNVVWYLIYSNSKKVEFYWLEFLFAHSFFLLRDSEKGN